MTDRTMRDEENASPAQLPLFAASSAKNKKRGRTYVRPNEKKKHRSTSGGGGGSSTKKRRKSSSKGRRRSNSNDTPRCAL